MKQFFPALIICLLLYSCVEKLKPTFKGVENIKVKTLSLSNIVVGADVVIHNPNPVGITLKKSDLDVTVEDVKVGDLIQNDPVEIPKKGNFNLPLDIMFKPQSLLKGGGLDGLVQMGLDMIGDQEVRILIEGDLTFDVLDQEITIPIKTEEVVALKK